PRLGAAARRRFSRGADRLIAGLAMLLAALGHSEAEQLAASAFAEMVGALVLARGADSQESDAILEGSRVGLKARLGVAKRPAGQSSSRAACATSVPAPTSACSPTASTAVGAPVRTSKASISCACSN